MLRALSGRIDALVTAERVRVYAIILVVIYAVAAIGWTAMMRHGTDHTGKPLGYDFITFYAASDLARGGHAAAAYNFDAIFAAEHRAVPADTRVFLWHYPPPFQLIVAPLALMPYPVALVVWLAFTLALYLALLRRMSDDRRALILGLAFPAVFLNLMHGQNGFLNTALLGFGLLWLDRRPWLAGVMLGLLVYKPHFGVLLPLLLLVQGRWKSITTAAVTAAGLCLASYAAYGAAPWIAFVKNLHVVSYVLEHRILPWELIPSVFVLVASLGAPLKLAYAVHAAVAVILAGLTAWAWRRPGSQSLKVALAVPAILAVSPYCFTYDLVLLAIPIGLLAEHGRTHDLPVGSKAAMLLAFITPVLFIFVDLATHVQLMVVGILVLYAAVWRALAAERSPAMLAHGSGAPLEATAA